MKDFKLIRFEYSPGYGDMLGESHSATLKQNSDGSWSVISRDREHHRAPRIITTYAVSDETVRSFEEFIEKKKVISLENRPKSDMFATDYSPWSCCIEYSATSFGRTENRYCSITEYKRYSGRDYDLMKEMDNRFTALRGDKISEVTEDTER